MAPRKELFPIEAGILPRVTTIASNATWTINADTTDLFVVTAQAVPVTSIPNPSGTPVDGQRLAIRYKDDGTARAISGWGAKFRASYTFTATLPATTVTNVVHNVEYKYNATDDKWDLLQGYTYDKGVIDVLLAGYAADVVSNAIAMELFA